MEMKADLPATASSTQVTSVKTPTFTIVARVVSVSPSLLHPTYRPSFSLSTDSFCAISTLNTIRQHNVSSTVDRGKLPDVSARA